MSASPNSILSSPLPTLLTPDQLRQYPDCGHYSEEETKQILQQLHLLASLTYGAFQTTKSSTHPHA